ncbi:sugar phosphorylase [Luminiphilus sp.]|nr:sugar phosphorylase [Luminiphilus sp.]
MNLSQRVDAHLTTLFSDCLSPDILAHWRDRLLKAMRLSGQQIPPAASRNLWDESDIALITYGDSIQSSDQKPLQVLHNFLNQRIGSTISWVHILPFHPWTSDDGFAVLDYSSVNESLGGWSDLTRIAVDYRMMADLVLNHCSSRSVWFENFRRGIHPGADYFYVPPADFDVSHVVRPRTSALLETVQTESGSRAVWCTFSADQVDFDFQNPAVIEEFSGIIRQLLDAGVRIFRLDAVAFLWKISGSSCINLPQTHEVVRLFRTLIECAQSDAIVITETNVPNTENLSYFGNSDEAHAIYNFSLPPLLIHSLLTGSSQHLRAWMMSMPPAAAGTTYFNFIASHDGIGLRPVEGLLSESDLEQLVTTLESFGGLISRRQSGEEESRAYEVNIALFDALSGTVKGTDELGLERFICAHAIMLGLEGVPAFYLHSLLGTQNDVERVRHTGHNRAINRHQWQLSDLAAALDNPRSSHHRVLAALQKLILLRKQQLAFHPNATQFTLNLGDPLFGFWRQSTDRRQSIFCVYNVSDQPQMLSIQSLNLIATQDWYDLVSGQKFDDSMSQTCLAPYQSVWISNR